MDRLCCFKDAYSQSSCSAGKGKSSQSSIKVTYGYSLVKGRTNHPIEDYHVSKFVRMKGKELGLFAIFDGHLGDSVPAYLQKHLFANILKEEEFWTYPDRAISKAYDKTDKAILSHSSDLGRGGSTAVTAILINGRKLWIANVGDSRAVLAKGGRVMQMTVDHEPSAERGSIENRGGFVSNLPGMQCSEVMYWDIIKSLTAELSYILVVDVDGETATSCVEVPSHFARHSGLPNYGPCGRAHVDRLATQAQVSMFVCEHCDAHKKIKFLPWRAT